MMITHRIFILLAAVMLAMSIPAEASGETLIEDKIDSIFVMASSLDIKYKDQVESARDSIAALGVDAVPHLIEMLGTPHGRERAALEAIFKKIGDKAVPTLTEALLTTDSLRLSRVAKILYFFPDTSSVENLLKVVNKPYYSARYQIIRALGKIGDPRAVPAVRAAMNDTIELVRTIASVSAGRLKDPTLLPDLLAAFEDDYYGTRMSAHEAFWTTECSIKTAFISTALEKSTVNAAKHLLKIIAEDTCQYEIEIIKPFFNSADPLVQSLALKAAFRLDPIYVRGILPETIDIDDGFILRQTIEELTGYYETKTPANP